MTRVIHITTPDELEAVADELEERLFYPPEDGKGWAEVCHLEDVIERARRRLDKMNGGAS